MKIITSQVLCANIALPLKGLVMIVITQYVRINSHLFLMSFYSTLSCQKSDGL